MPDDSADRIMDLLAAGVPLSLLVDLADPAAINYGDELTLDLTAGTAPRLTRAETA